MSSANWKNAERKLAEELQKEGIPAYRVSRAGDFGKSDTDVKIEGAEFLQLDSKYTEAKPFRHHGLLRVIKDKYCKKPEDVPILFTKNYKEHSGCITVEAKFFAKLLQAYLLLQKRDNKNE